MRSVLVTSFEPFGGHPRNASLEVALALAQSPMDDIVLDAVVLPVVAGVCAEVAWRRIEQTRPDLVLAMGQAGGSTHIRLEDRAVNLDHFTAPDNAGFVRQQRIIADGPESLPAAVDIERVLIEVRRAKFAVQHSLSAGRYVCNHLYYQLLHRRRSASNFGTLFVHLPYLPEQVPVGRWMPSMELAEQVACVRAVIAGCLGDAREER